MKPSQHCTDTDLIISFQQGHERSFDILFSRYQADVQRVAFHYVKSMELATDLTQDIFLRIFMSLKKGSYQDQGNFLAWALQVTRNICLDYLRKMSRQQKKYRSLIAGQEETYESKAAESRLLAIERAKAVQGIIDQLPREQKAVVYYRYFEALSFREIADKMQTSINTSIGRARYGLLHLRKEVMRSPEFFR